jgi:hypothetical protein
VPITVAERFKARVCSRPLSGIAGSSPAGGHGRLWCVCCTVRTKGKKSQDNQNKEVRIMYRARERGQTSGRGHECLSVVSVVCCQTEVFAAGRSPVQRSSTDCGVSLCVM